MNAPHEDLGSFGKYELIDRLGEGSVGRVYLAIRSGPMGFRKEVALKQLRPSLVSRNKQLKSLINEARLGGRLRHRNIVEVHEFDEVDETYYLAMEHVRGWTLRQLLARLPRGEGVPPNVVAEIAAQLCAGLAYAHDAVDECGVPMKLVHRDIKPTNVIVSLEGVVKIMDFGIAKAKTNLFHTTPGFVKGTPIYMSPEQVRGEELDRRSDLFAIGTIITELITGAPPFCGSSPFEVAQGVVSGDASKAIGEVATRAPEFAPVVARALRHHREDRYPDAAALLADVEKVRRSLDAGPSLLDWMTEPIEASPNRTHGACDPGEDEKGTTLSLPVSAEPRLDAVQHRHSPSLRAPSWAWAAIGVLTIALVFLALALALQLGRA